MIGANALSYNPVGYEIKLAKVVCIFCIFIRRYLRVLGIVICKILTYKKCTLRPGPLRNIHDIINTLDIW